MGGGTYQILGLASLESFFSSGSEGWPSQWLWTMYLPTDGVEGSLSPGSLLLSLFIGV